MKEQLPSKERVYKILRMAEMSAEIMRDTQRTGGWEGAERVARQFDRIAKIAREIESTASEPSSECSHTETVDLEDSRARWCVRCGAFHDNTEWIFPNDRATVPPAAEVFADPVSRRDSDWVLAIAHALGTDSCYRVPIVPSVDEFQKLFAALRAVQPPFPAPKFKVGDRVRVIRGFAERTVRSVFYRYQVTIADDSTQYICVDESELEYSGSTKSEGRT